VNRAVLVLIAALLIGAGGVVACGDDDDGGGGDESAAETLNVGVIPIADVAPLYLGMDKGFFKEEQLTIKPQLAEGGAAILPAVVSGDFQIGFSNTISLLIAASKDLPVQIISQGVLAGKSESEAWADLLVLKDGPIKQPGDLEGKTIAVNTLNNICEVTIKASLEKDGVAVDTLEFAEVPFPDMNAALEQERVDAACVVEPFVSQGKAGAARGINPFYVRTAPDLTVATYFTSDQYAQENADVVDRFVRAMEKSLAYAQSHPGEGPRRAARLHGDPPGGRGGHQAAGLARRPQRAHDRAAVRAEREVRADRGATRPSGADPGVTICDKRFLGTAAS
jgi:NitT/TauT family transport system substrate-binding protein